MNDLDVGIIYTHERQWMQCLLTTLVRGLGTLRVRLILVDNASEDGTASWEQMLPDTLVLPNWRRMGYAENLNRILRVATARYVLLLNTDVFFDPAEPCVAKMVAFMDQHPQCGLAGCRVLHPDGHDAHAARRFQTFPILLARRFGLRKIFHSKLDWYFYQDRDPLGTWPCDWISGCFMMLRREVCDCIGYFDTGFTKYFEDVDYAVRVAQAGWQVLYYGNTYCYHHEVRASRRLFSSNGWKHIRSYLRYLSKWGYLPDSRPKASPRKSRAA